jgi:hypothetical protein
MSLAQSTELSEHAILEMKTQGKLLVLLFEFPESHIIFLHDDN